MNVSLAAITVAYVAVFGQEFSGNTAYKDAAEKVRLARPRDWRAVFTDAEALVTKNRHNRRTWAELGKELYLPNR
jgi:hypothetical protein